MIFHSLMDLDPSGLISSEAGVRRLRRGSSHVDEHTLAHTARIEKPCGPGRESRGRLRSHPGHSTSDGQSHSIGARLSLVSDETAARD
jgi:hypothetical protein